MLPRPAELNRALAHIKCAGAGSDPNAALADVFWALLNNSEFILNH